MSVVMDLKTTETILDYGDRGLLLQVDHTAEVLMWTSALQDAQLPGVVDIVPASRTVLVKLAGPQYRGVTRQRLHSLRIDPSSIESSPPDGRIDAVIDVVYDGADLGEVAERTGLTPAQVINAHTSTPWRVGFGGSTPGFAYLVGGDPRLMVPRRADQRDTVPAGAVALAGEFSGVYPRSAPGGWQLIGRTDAAIWDITRATPALLTPGMWVRFRAA